MRRSHVLLMLAANALILSGLAVGQRAAQSKLAKYQQPASVNRMEWLLLQAKITVIADHIPMDGSIATPNFYFDSRTGKVGAIAMVDGKQLGAETASSLRGDLNMSAYEAEGTIRHFIPELEHKDFEMEFRDFTCGDKAKETGNDYCILAEYTNGELVLH